MRGHQKYFAVQNDRGELLPAFVAISNTKVRDPAVSRRGYERVLRARLSDAKFFLDEDRKVPLRSRLEKLGRRTFVQGLGTELERVQRLRELALWLHGATGRGDPGRLAEAAELCKTDLTTGMVGEFPELQGTMGRVYALHSGVDPAVADAIFEHYLPRGAEDRLPSGDLGALLGMADRLDQLVGLFALGKEPTGTADPFGLRRAALGLLRVTLARGYRFDVDEALRAAQKMHGKDDPGRPAHRGPRPDRAGKAPGGAADRPREEPGAVRGHRGGIQAHRQHPRAGAAEGDRAGRLPQEPVQDARRKVPGRRLRSKPRPRLDGAVRQGGLPRRVLGPRGAPAGGRPIFRRGDGDGSRPRAARQPPRAAAGAA